MDWADVLWYRDGGVDEVVERFATEGVAPEQVHDWLVGLATGALGWYDLRYQVNARTAALVAIELDLLGDSIRQDAAELRGYAIHDMNQTQKIVDIAGSLGLTRQAASRSANAAGGGGRIMRALGDIGRTVKEELQ